MHLLPKPQRIWSKIWKTRTKTTPKKKSSKTTRIELVAIDISGIQKMNVAAGSDPSEPAAAVPNILDKDSYQRGSIHTDIVVSLDDPSGLAPLVERARKSLRDAVPPHTRR